METEFTKRSWEICTEPESEHYLLTIDCGGVMKIHVITFATDITFAESIERKANAHLIAAAPEMYEFIERLSDLDECQMLKAEIKVLLAKARGEANE